MKLQLLAASARHPAARPDAPPAIEGLNLTLEAGEQVAIIGPSGAGKTTLLQVLGVALAPSAGQLLLDDTDPWRLSRRARHALRGTVFTAPQVPPLPPRQRVITSVLAGKLPAWGLMASLRSLFYPRDIAQAHAALEAFDLSEKLFDRVDRLSGGERQRVGLARALVAPARLWLVDEPLSALDPARAQLAMETLTGQARAAGITLVATLHQVDRALAHFPRIIGLRSGAVAFDLPSAQVTPERLARLYDQFEHELRGAPAEGAWAADSAVQASSPSPAPVVMHCR